MPVTGYYLSRSRHGTIYHFRRRVPDDLQPLVGKRFIVASLKTGDRRQATVRARAAASQTDTLFEELKQMVRRKRQPEPITTDFGFKIDLSELGRPKSIVVTDATPADSEAINSAIETALRNLPAPNHNRDNARPITQNPTIGGKSIMETWEDYKAEKIAAVNWKDGESTAKYDHFPHIRTFIKVVGDKKIAAIAADEIESFTTHVLNDPNGGSPGNRDKRLTRVAALFRWAKDKRRITDDFSALFRYPGRIAQNPYLAFDDADLKALFESAEYRNCTFDEPSKYWIPIIALHTGARLNEICQLTRSDIGEHDGIATISITDDNDGDKRLKNTASRRIVPIHSALIRCGFLDYVGKIKSGRLFPELPEDTKAPGSYKEKMSEYFTAYRRERGVGAKSGRSNKSFHSFRTTFISRLRLADVPPDRRRRIVGHEATDVHDGTYHGGDITTMFRMSTLQSDIEKVQYSIKLSPYRR